MQLSALSYQLSGKSLYELSVSTNDWLKVDTAGAVILRDTSRD